MNDCRPDNEHVMLVLVVALGTELRVLLYFLLQNRTGWAQYDGLYSKEKDNITMNHLELPLHKLVSHYLKISTLNANEQARHGIHISQFTQPL